jgi:hypothetical protein
METYLKTRQEIYNGRKKSCGACGYSESNELMQLNTIQPHDSGIIDLSGEVYGEGNDLQEVLQLDNLLVVVA